VIKALSLVVVVVVYVRVIHWCCHARTSARIPSSCCFFFFFLARPPLTISFVTHTHTPHIYYPCHLVGRWHAALRERFQNHPPQK
jgi:hypothetical protein